MCLYCGRSFWRVGGVRTEPLGSHLKWEMWGRDFKRGEALRRLILPKARYDEAKSELGSMIVRGIGLAPRPLRRSRGGAGGKGRGVDDYGLSGR